MEDFVSDLLNNADLTTDSQIDPEQTHTRSLLRKNVLTKKLVRVRYKEHMGRELSVEEKDKINGMVYAFISEYAARQRNSDSSSPQSTKSVSPGDKENRVTNINKKIILKGHVIDKQRLKKVNRQPQPAKKVMQKVQEPIKSYPKRKRTPRLEFAEVITAVLDSDNPEMSSDQDGHQSSDRSDESVSDLEPQEDLKQALAKLKKARDRKIQLSQEKKQKFLKKATPDRDKVKKSLYGKSLVGPHNNEEDVNTSSSSVILISEDDAFASKKKASKKRLIDSDSDSEMDIPLAKRQKIANKKPAAELSKKNKLENCTVVLSDLDSKIVNCKNGHGETLHEGSSDSESSTGDTPLIKKHSKVKSKIKNSPTDRKENGSGSDGSTGDPPLIKKRAKVKSKINCSPAEAKSSESDSDCSTGDTQLIKKRSKVKSKIKCSPADAKSSESDSDCSTGDTPLIKKRSKVKSKIKHSPVDAKESGSDSDGSTGDTPLIKKRSKVKSKIKHSPVDSDSDCSTGDTPLANKRKLSAVTNDKHRITDVGISLHGSTSKKTNSKATVETSAQKQKSRKSIAKEVITINSKSDSDMSTDNTPLGKKRKHFSSKHKRLNIDPVSDSDGSTGDTPLARKQINWKKKNNETVGKTKSEMLADSSDEDSDSSSGNTPLAKKRKTFTTNKSTIRTDSSTSEHSSDSDNTLEESQIAQNKRKSTLPDNSSDAGSDVDTPLKLVKARGKSKLGRQLSISSDEDTPVKKRSKLDTKLNGTGKSSPPISDSDDSEDMPLAQLNKSAERKLKAEYHSSDDNGGSTSKGTKKAKKVGQEKKKVVKKPVADEESHHLKQLRKICRACGMFVRNDRELIGCNTDKQKVSRLKEVLQKAGMKGKPSMKKAEEIRLKKEAADLNKDNIISTEPGRGKRKVKSLYSRRKPSPKKSPSPKKQMKNVFGGLKGIIDSEGSDDD